VFNKFRTLNTNKWVQEITLLPVPKIKSGSGASRRSEVMVFEA
jgi:hypothetical protein